MLIKLLAGIAINAVLTSLLLLALAQEPKPCGLTGRWI